MRFEQEPPESQLPSDTKKQFSFIDLFAGIGGLRKGFESIGGECVFTCEWDKYARETYEANFPNDQRKIAWDIRGAEAESDRIPTHDLLLAGFPCQPFSIAGVSKKNALGRPHGFECDTQGTLFFEVERILRDKRPRAFLLENVKNLKSHDKGRTWKTILRVLQEELDYHVDTCVVDARGYVPQHRERIFIAGFAKPSNFSFETFKPLDPSEGPKLREILHPTEFDAQYPEARFTDSEGKAARKYVLSKHLWKYLRDYAAKHKLAGNGFGYGLVGPKDTARTLSARYYKDGSEILIKRGSGTPRRLTPRECARLMGFDEPEAPRFVIPDSVSDTRAYKQFGNAVVVPVVRAIAAFMEPHILAAKSRGEEQAPPLVGTA